MISSNFSSENSQPEYIVLVSSVPRDFQWIHVNRMVSRRGAEAQRIKTLITPMLDSRLTPRILCFYILAFLFFATLGFCRDAPTATKISFHGYHINQPRWRSTEFPKVITLAGGGIANDADGIYGSLGWIFPAFESTGDMPSFISPTDLPHIETRTFKSSSYAGDIDDPLEPPNANVVNIPQDLKAIAYQNPGEGKEALLYHLKLQETVPPSFLVGIAFGNLAHPSETPFGTASFRAAINDGPTTAQLPAIANDGLIDWIFFRVDSAQSGDIVNIYGTGGPNGMTNLAIIAFDPVP